MPYLSKSETSNLQPANRHHQSMLVTCNHGLHAFHGLLGSMHVGNTWVPLFWSRPHLHLKETEILKKLCVISIMIKFTLTPFRFSGQDIMTTFAHSLINTGAVFQCVC